ncbi:hypothetical protein SJI00_21400 [Pseudomonas sp. RP23018S]|uniref:hypothetical protein n=1 Tax=Pseudomonas sp. RP23018S TaxID=3096037 RepID=UPI002ACA7BCD|nr:hypothetical protein [Pseudomonas sp. RP23018S]MDZ5605335.1 hypothetical protein [Pseudomonas sp. RP23018S]
MGKKIDVAKGLASDVWSKVVHDQADRTGLSAARVANSLDKGVDADVVALQVTRNQEKNSPADPLAFTGEDMQSVAKFYKANKRRVAYTGVQAAEIDSNQAALDDACDSGSNGALPA